ncbi:MAG TPA: PIN domain-containing protein [Devosia sp.]
MLDTNMVSEVMRRPDGRAGLRFKASRDKLAVSVLVAAELRFGALKRQSEQLARRVDSILGVLPVLPLNHPADRYYAHVRNHLEAIGRPISGNDLLIAAHALALDLTLVTANIREFSRVPNLRVENWLD